MSYSAYTVDRPHPDHQVRVSRFARGKTPIRPQRVLYGTRLRCSCGDSWSWNNGPPSLGGNQWAGFRYKEHLIDKGVARVDT